MEAAGLHLNASASVCNHASVSNQVCIHAIRHVTNVVSKFGAKHAPVLELFCRCTISAPCSRSGSQLCLFSVAVFVTTQTLRTPEPFILITHLPGDAKQH